MIAAATLLVPDKTTIECCGDRGEWLNFTRNSVTWRVNLIAATEDITRKVANTIAAIWADKERDEEHQAIEVFKKSLRKPLSAAGIEQLTDFIERGSSRASI